MVFCTRIRLYTAGYRVSRPLVPLLLCLSSIWARWTLWSLASRFLGCRGGAASKSLERRKGSEG